MKLQNLTPMLETADITETIRFYTELLGFTCEEILDHEGQPFWTSLAKDGIGLMFAARNSYSKIEKPTMTGSLYFYPENIEELWFKVKDKAKVEYGLEDFDYGMREFAIRDCNGYLLQFGQAIS